MRSKIISFSAVGHNECPPSVDGNLFLFVKAPNLLRAQIEHMLLDAWEVRARGSLARLNLIISNLTRVRHPGALCFTPCNVPSTTGSHQCRTYTHKHTQTHCVLRALGSALFSSYFFALHRKLPKKWKLFPAENDPHFGRFGDSERERN